jgi:Ser/Thr protein kinase RdoA (MazF antagonist)
VDNLYKAASQFIPHDSIVDIQEHGNGNINATYLVTLKSGREKKFIIQRINTTVFHEPDHIMANIRTVTEHINNRLIDTPLDSERRWEMLQVISTHDGQDHWIDQDSSYWRAVSFIDNAACFDTINNNDLAEEVGYALGLFHSLLSDLPEDRLNDTLEGFHITPLYLQHYYKVLDAGKVKRTPEINYCMQIIEERSTSAHVLENARAEKLLFNRTIHGDPKVNNIMIDNNSGQAVSIVDLDTVKPGLIHYDIGDCLRSGCNPLGEVAGNWEAVKFESELCKSILNGYHSLAGSFLTDNDYDYIYDAVRLLSFELGLRFFTDYLEGNVYFKAKYQDHNLQRALVQFKLSESIELQAKEIQTIVKDLR